ncbi:hypothetical protein B0T21DRAFT_298162 [Apiosordaria backusii]|uniref:Protein kinase domain-containing protein n=1 Tax=Apiosordaria backusii TaxID=314023 RepID=A0AA40A706_9PEZI|nr:hypothetical protein B0T21DRAFT_298162 [Apiosordaria backusii]
MARISAEAIHEILESEARPHVQSKRQHRASFGHFERTDIEEQRHKHRDRPKYRRSEEIPRAPDTSSSAALPLIIYDDDPILDFPPKKWIASMLGNTGMLYRFSDDLVYKSNITPREVELMEAAGSLTMRPLSRVVWKGSRPSTGTKAVIMEGGEPFRARRIPMHKRHKCVVEMFLVVENLHKRGIIHGNIKESKFIWGNCNNFSSSSATSHQPAKRLKMIDFAGARFMEEDKNCWNSLHVTNSYMTPKRMQCLEQGLLLPAPTVFDDYYALAITLWSFFTGKTPGNRQFNRKYIKKEDLAEVEDEMIKGWIRKVFTMAGCKIVSAADLEEYLAARAHRRSNQQQEDYHRQGHTGSDSSRGDVQQQQQRPPSRRKPSCEQMERWPGPPSRHHSSPIGVYEEYEHSPKMQKHRHQALPPTRRPSGHEQELEMGGRRRG